MTEPSASATSPQTAAPPAPLNLTTWVTMERQTKATFNLASTDAVDLFSKRADDFHGEIARYTARPDCDELPPVNRYPLLRVSQFRDEVAEAWARNVNAAAAKASGDLHPDAKSDLVDPETGGVLIKDASLPALIAYEQSLVKLRAYVEKLPTLPGPSRWLPEPDEEGVYRAEPVEITNVEERPTPVVGFPGDEHNPPVVEFYNREVVTGVWNNTQLSTALPFDVVRTYLKRIDALVQLIREAIGRTNAAVMAEPRNDGEIFASYVFR